MGSVLGVFDASRSGWTEYKICDVQTAQFPGQCGEKIQPKGLRILTNQNRVFLFTFVRLKTICNPDPLFLKEHVTLLLSHCCGTQPSFITLDLFHFVQNAERSPNIILFINPAISFVVRLSPREHVPQNLYVYCILYKTKP